jgi:hypothetical protein
VKLKVYEIGKQVLFGSTFLMVVVVGMTGLIGIGADREYVAVAGWFVIGAVGFWLPVASMALLAMALNEPRGNGSETGIDALRLGDWLVIFFSAVVVGFTTFQNWSALLRIGNGTHTNLNRETVFAVALMSMASSAAVCVYFRLPWVKYLFLAIATLLFMKSELWLEFPGFSQNLLAESFMVGYKSFPTLLALASFGYLHRRFGELPKNR